MVFSHYGIALKAIGQVMQMNNICAAEALSGKFDSDLTFYMEKEGVESELILELLETDLSQLIGEN